MNEATTSASGAPRTTVTHEEISRHAQELWEKYGRPSGRDEEIWLEAERELQSRPETPSTDRALSIMPGGGQSAPLGETPSSIPTPPATPPAAASRTGRSGATATPKMPGGRNRKA